MQELSLPEVQTSDFAHWQREQQKAGAWDAHLDFWKQQLSGAPEALDLPTDTARPSARSGQGHWLPMHLDVASTKRLKDLSTEHGTSMLAVVIAAFQVSSESLHLINFVFSGWMWQPCPDRSSCTGLQLPSICCLQLQAAWKMLDLCVDVQA